jgi:hypothetical protein
VFEQADELVVVVPYNPWGVDPECFDCVRELCCYQRELGIIIFGGCR